METVPGKILVVDDNEMNRDMLSRRLAKKGHALEVAEDGTRALAMISDSEFDLVLLDIMMPGIDGYEVLRRLRETHDPSDLPVIMATAKTESEDIVAALKIGANDYVTKPFRLSGCPRPRQHPTRPQEIARRSGRSPSADEERPRSRGQDSADIAALRDTGCGRRALRLALRAVRRARGRHTQYHSLDARTLGLFVLDVSGHGVASSLLSVTLSRLMSGVRDASSVLWTMDPASGGLRIASPMEVADELSRRFPYDNDNHQYFTLVYGTLDLESRIFSYISAGHPPIVHLRKGADPVFHSSTGQPVSLLPAILGPSTYYEVEMVLEPGDRLYLYSDGIPEAQVAGGEEFGEERIADTPVGRGRRSRHHHHPPAGPGLGVGRRQGTERRRVGAGGRDRIANLERS